MLLPPIRLYERIRTKGAPGRGGRGAPHLSPPISEKCADLDLDSVRDVDVGATHD